MSLTQLDYACTSEIYQVQKVVEVEVLLTNGARERTPARIRLEALRNMRDGQFNTRAYIEQAVVLQLQPTLSSGEQNNESRMWVAHKIPWTQGATADEALRQALRFISEKCAEPTE